MTTKRLTPLDMGSNKITSVANGSASSDAAAFGQIPVLDSTAGDIQPAGTQAAGSVGQAADSGHTHPALTWLPSDNGLLAANGDPALYATNLVCTAGTLYLAKIQIRQLTTITNLWWNFNGTGTLGTGSTGTWTGLYAGTGFTCTTATYTAGQLMSGTSSDISSLITGAVPLSFALATAQVGIPAGNFVYAAIVTNYATTQPSLWRALGGSNTSSNGGLTAATYRWATNGTGRTTLPSSITLSSNSGTTMTAWAGVS